MPQVLSFILRRVLTIIPILLATTLLVFLLLEFAPGDPAATSQGQAVSQEHRERFNEQHGLNDPLPLRYVRFLGNVLQGVQLAQRRQSLAPKGTALIGVQGHQLAR